MFGTSNIAIYVASVLHGTRLVRDHYPVPLNLSDTALCQQGSPDCKVMIMVKKEGPFEESPPYFIYVDWY